MSDGMPSTVPYDVCLSFAGEQRNYVDRVAAALKQAGVRIFYDRYETTNLWGEDLVTHLDAVFRRQARFCVMFVSADYARKIWPSHERRSAQARAIRSSSAYILPVRFDETEIPGLLDTVGFLSATELTPEQVANFLIGKLTGPVTAATGTRFHTTRTTRIVASQLFGLMPVVGRENVIHQLATAFHDEDRRPVAPPILRVLTGIGGIGKSSAARAYGIEHQDRYSLIWWIRAEEPALVTEDFRALLVALGVADVQRLAQPVQLAHVMLANRPDRWLLVFDNVPHQASLHGVMPPEGAGDIIATSRSISWANPRMVISVPPLTSDVGSSLLREISEDDSHTDADALVEELGGLPLALHQAGSYVAENPIGLAEYLRLYRQHRAALHHLGTAPDYDLRVGTTWKVSVQMMPQTAQTVLNVLAWLAPEMIPLDLLSDRSHVEGVPASVAEQVNAAFAGELDYLNATSALSRYGLTTVNGRDADIHRLIQAVTRDNAEAAGTAVDWATAAAAIVLAAIPTPPANADRITTWLRLRPHIVHHLRITPVPDGAISLRLRHWAAQWTGEVGRPGEALALFASLIDREVRFLGETHPDTLRSQHSQAQWTGESADFEAAIALFDRLIGRWREVGNADHPEALRAMHSSAYWIGEAGQPAQACERLREVLTRRTRVLGAEHPDTLRTMHSLAYRIGQTGDYPTACTMLERLLPIRIRVLGSEHPHTLRTRYSLAQSFGRGGDPVRARDLTEALLTDQTRVLGEDHPHTLRTRYNLAHWTGQAGDRVRQRDALVLLLTDQRRVLGSDHPDTRLSQTALEAVE